MFGQFIQTLRTYSRKFGRFAKRQHCLTIQSHCQFDFATGHYPGFGDLKAGDY